MFSVNQHEVLMHHADAGVDGVAGIVHHNLFAVHEDVTGGGLQKPVELVHQGGLSGAVFTENCVDFSFVDGEINPVIRSEITELLDDVSHLDDRRIHVHIFFCQVHRLL